MTDLNERDMRARIAAFLPRAIDRALESYRSFSKTTIPEDAKGFTAYHGACRVAIAHVELLLKLARWAQLAGGKDQGDQGLAGMLAAAQAQLDDHYNRYPQAAGAGEGPDDIF